tara:strand:+ start:40 stop:219 length:180 start_codon:yes stop_codon:yes gene_type:complete
MWSGLLVAKLGVLVHSRLYGAMFNASYTPPPPPPPVSNLLMEDSSVILLENGNYIELES